MAGQARCLCVLWILTGLLLLLSLPIPSTEFELHDQDWEGLRSDLVTLHRLEGSAERTTYGKAGRERLSESMPVAYARTGFLSSEGFENKFHKEPMTLVHGLEGCEDFAKCVSESEQDFDAFLREIERQKAKDVLLTASEVSRSPRLRLLLLLDQAWETQHRATEDYRLDPHQSVEVSPACLVNDSCLTVGANRNAVVKIFGTVDSHGQSVSGYTGPSLAHLMMKPAFRNAGLFSLGNGTSFTFRSSFLRAFGQLHSSSTVVETEEHNTNIYQTLDNAGELAQFHVPKPRPDTSTRYDRQHILLLEDEAIVREAGTLLFEKHPAVSSLYVLENGGWPKLVKGNLGPLTEESRLVLVGHGRKMDGAGKISLGMFGAKDVAEIVSRMSQEGKRIKTTSVVACEVGADEEFRGTLLRELRARSVETELHTRTSLLQVSHSGQKVSVEVTPEGLQFRHRDPSKKVVDTLRSDGRMVSRVEPGDMGEAVYHDQRNFLGKTGTTPKVRDDWTSDRIDFGDNPQGELQKYAAQWFDAKADERAPTPTAESDTMSYLMDNTNNVDEILKACRKINTVKELVNEIHHQAKYGDQTDIYYNLHDWIYKVNPETLYVYLVGRKINIESIKKIVKQVDQNDYEKINWASVNSDSSIKDVKETIRREVKQTNFETIEERLNDYMKQIKNVIDGHRNKYTYSDMRTNIDRQDFQDTTRLKNTLETLERLYTNLQGKQDIKREIRNCAYSDGKYLIEGLSKDSSDISSAEKISRFLQKPNTEIETIIQHKIKLYKELRANIENRISIDINAFTSSIDTEDHKIIATQLNREDYVSFTKETLQGKYKTGTHSLEKESWLADYFMASIFSESVRNFRTFPAVLMCLQGYENNKYKQKFLNYLFENHPMTRGGTWVSPNRRGFHGASSVEYSSKLKNFKIEKKLQNDLNTVFSKESDILKTWKKSNLIDLDNYFNSLLPASGSRGSTGILGGSDDGAVTLQDLHSESGVELSLELSAYHARSQALLTQQIQERLQQDFGKTAGDYRLEPGSVQQEDGQFRCRLSSLKEPTKSLDWHLDLNPEGLRYTEKILEKCHEVNSMELAEGEGISAAASPHQALKHVEHAGKAVAVVGVMLGLQGAMRAFEEGDIEHGTVAVLQTSHGVAGMILGMIAKRAKVLTSKPAQVMVRTALKKAFIVMPLVGIAFGIYNIEEDFKRKDILGYIDAGLDITMLGLDVVELLVPEVAPFLAPLNLALSVLRMVVDYVYMGIQAELDKLPEDADFLDKLDAVLCGVTKGSEHLMLDVLSFFYTIPYREIEEGQTLVEKISDYRKYYTFQKEEGGRKAIDFNGGEDSWNGGNITFCLSDDGLSKFCMDSFVSSKSRFGKQCWELETDKTTQDIILGIGESHHLQYRSVQLKVFMFIPANTMEVISGYEAESHTRFGKYYGNQAANNFFTVQNPDDKKTWEVMLSYYYQLYGENGDDTFFLGPQKSYVEGRAGRDTYIIPETGGNVIINNYHPEKTIDVLMLKVNYSQISVSKSGPDVILSYLSSHHVRIQNWFTGEAYRHLQMISSDGVLFDIPTLVVSSPRLVAQGVNKMSEKRGQEVDVTQPLLQTVTDIFGSSYNDRLIGNDQNNLIDGGGGRDYVKGGEGEDIYVVKNRPGTQVQIENFSVDKKTDLLLMESRLHDLRARVSGNDLVLFSVRHSDSITLLNWFRSENNQHLLIVTEDFVTLTLANNTDSCRVTGDHFQAECLLSQSIDYSKASGPQSIDMEQDEVLQRVKEVRGSDFDDKIWGNARDNGLTPGRGSDVLAGRNGADWYMVTPAQGLKTISNYASDLVTDMLFIKERYGNIEAKCEGRDLVLYVNGSKDVVLERWFEGRPFQHLQVQTADGFRFTLAENSSACHGFVKIPLSIDFRERSSNGEIMKMDEDEFASVVEMHGSRGFDVMIGNGQDNVLDPDAGGARMAGGDGVDTYVVKPGYGTRIEIDNFAEDGATDTVELAADFLGSHFAVRAESHDLLLTGAVTGGGPEITIRLLHYSVSPRYQHISFRTADRFLFRVSYPTLSNGSLSHTAPEIMVYKADLRGLKGDQYLDLSSDDQLSATSTVYGSPSHSNHLKGNGCENALFGGAADDALDGDSGDDTLVGAGGNDILLGGTGDDTLYGGEGDDYLIGSLGRDMLIPGPGRDMVDGGPGRDTVLYQGDHEMGVGVYVNLLSGEGWGADAEGDFLRDVENVIGSIYPDVLVSGREPTLLKGSAGNDILVSWGGEQGGGGDYLMGGDGSDVYLLDDLHGFVNIDNCAEDNATDIIYLRSLSVQSVACSSFPDTIFLTIHGPPNRLVKVALRAWNSELGCQHLEVLFSEGPVSVDTLLEMCEARWKAKLHIALGLYLLFASASLACALYLVCRAERRARGCGRKREEKGQGGRKQQEREEGAECDNGATTAVEEAQP